MIKKDGEMKKIIKKSIYIIFALAIFISSLKIAQAEISTDTLVSLTNSSRAQNNLAPLSPNNQLQTAAFAKAQDMFKNQYFAHTSPSGKTPWDFINGSGYNYVYAGENLAIGYSDNAELQNAWMNSTSHRENILSPNFREIGIASVSGTFEGSATVIVVEMFGSTQIGQSAKISSDSSNQTSSSTNFSIDIKQSGVMPTKIFVGDTIDLKATINGTVSEVYFKIGNDKFDLSNSRVSKNANIYVYQKKVNFNQIGTLPITLTAIDKAGNSKSKGFGNLESSPKILAGLGAYRDKAFGNGQVSALTIVLSVISLTLISGATVYIILRRRQPLKLKLKLT